MRAPGGSCFSIPWRGWVPLRDEKRGSFRYEEVGHGKLKCRLTALHLHPPRLPKPPSPAVSGWPPHHSAPLAQACTSNTSTTESALRTSASPLESQQPANLIMRCCPARYAVHQHTQLAPASQPSLCNLAGTVPWPFLPCSLASHGASLCHPAPIVPPPSPCCKSECWLQSGTLAACMRCTICL